MTAYKALYCALCGRYRVTGQACPHCHTLVNGIRMPLERANRIGAAYDAMETRWKATRTPKSKEQGEH